MKKLSIKKPVTTRKTFNTTVDALYERIAVVIREAKATVVRSIDTTMVKAYWHIGKYLVEEEQKGAKRAEYGNELLKTVSLRLNQEFGKGFGISTLEDVRKFYLVYSTPLGHQKPHAMRGELSTPDFSADLSWTHYRTLMRISRLEARRFYEVEAIKNRWSARELERQANSLLFDRLAKSKDKEGLLRLVHEGQEITKPADAIKDPFILEFLNIPEAHQLVESKLEEALITNLQHFLLELGRGFAFIARQKRLTLDGKHYYTDLVFYHTVLKCHILIDLKTHELTHADLGQMLLYVNYYDRECLSEGDNPTIGLVLCTEKSDGMANYLLGDKAKQIFASKYQFHLPSEEELETELKRELHQLRDDLP
jgi:predicted nuclease of restriction endonuclease-like (RecB) superfamily